MARRRPRRKKWLPLILGIGFFYIILKVFFNYLPVEVVQARVSELEDTLEGEFIVLREEKVITAPNKGYFIQVKNEGERVAKDAVLGFLEGVSGTSLQKKDSVTIRAPGAGLLSYQVDGLESICAPQIWSQLDLNKVEVFLQGKGTFAGEKDKMGQEGEVVAGEAFCKIVNNLESCYFYWAGVGAYPEKIKEGGEVRLRLTEKQDLILKGSVVELSRQMGEYGFLIKIMNLGNLSPSRREKGEIIVQSYRGIVLPEKVLVEKEGEVGVYLFQKGRAVWREVEKVACLWGQVVLAGLTEKDWVISEPQLVTEGKRVKRINK